MNTFRHYRDLLGNRPDETTLRERIVIGSILLVGMLACCVCWFHVGK